MEGSFNASFPPRPAAAVDAAAASQYPSWFVLDKNAGLAGCGIEEDTTAEAMTSTGRTIKFTFWLEPPPAVSHVLVHETVTHCAVEAEVVSSAKGLVLLRRNIYEKPHDGEYFVYQAAAAGHGRSKPSLTPLPCLPDMLSTLSRCATILPFDDGQFLLADLTVDYIVSEYRLHVFSSKTAVWSTTLPLRARRSDGLVEEPEKVIALGGSVLGWVVSKGGIIVCDVLGQGAINDARWIPLPKPHSECEGSALHIRDVACCGNGFIKFVDMDLRFRQVTVDSRENSRWVTKITKDLDHTDTIFDSELLLPEGSWAYAQNVSAPDGWKIRTCYRHISWNYWRKGHVVDVDDIAVYNPRHCTMLPELWDEDVGRWTLRKLRANQPTLSIHGDNMVYLRMVSKEERHDNQDWIVGVDLGKKTVEMLEPDHISRSHGQPLTFSQYLNTPPSVEEIIHAANRAQNDHLSSGSVTQHNLPLQQNMLNADGYYNASSYGYADNAHPGYGYGNNNQYPTPWSANFAQALHHNMNSLGPGSVYPMNTQLTYPIPVPIVNTAPIDQQFYPVVLLPPRPILASAPSSPFAPPWRPGQMAFRR